MKINISLEMLKHVFQYFTRILNSEVQNLQLLIVKQLFANTELKKDLDHVPPSSLLQLH